VRLTLRRRPEQRRLGSSTLLEVSFDDQGRALEAKVGGASSAGQDAALGRCVKVILEGLAYPASGLIKVTVTHLFSLPAPQNNARHRCSPIASLPLGHRRGIWRERLESSDPVAVYLDARRSCELPRWADRRALLELALEKVADGVERVAVAARFEIEGEKDAAALLRREAVRRAVDPEALRRVKLALLGAEHYPLGTFLKRYDAAADDQARLAVVRRFLSVAPHDALLRRRLLALLEALGQKDALLEESRRIRQDPFAAASLLADCGSALHRLGQEQEARRAFGELAERAPEDPWARAYLGDRLRNEGWFEDAIVALGPLERLAPDAPTALLRQALAASGAGRLDLAERLLLRLAQTGGRSGDGAMASLASHLAVALNAEARSNSANPEEAKRLTAAGKELPQANPKGFIMVRAPAAGSELVVQLVSQRDTTALRLPEVTAPGLGLYLLPLDATAETGARLSLARRTRALPPTAPFEVEVVTLVPGEGLPRALVTRATLPLGTDAATLQWNGQQWSKL
jgi:tetratricopeptide (TPR) repeat protein